MCQQTISMEDQYVRGDGFIHVVMPYHAYALIHMPDILSVEVDKNISGKLYFSFLILQRKTHLQSLLLIPHPVQCPPLKYSFLYQPDAQPLPSLMLSLCKSKINDSLSAVQKQSIMIQSQITFTDIHNNPNLLTDPEVFLSLFVLITSYTSQQMDRKQPWKKLKRLS